MRSVFFATALGLLLSPSLFAQPRPVPSALPAHITVAQSDPRFPYLQRLETQHRIFLMNEAAPLTRNESFFQYLVRYCDAMQIGTHSRGMIGLDFGTGNEPRGPRLVEEVRPTGLPAGTRVLRFAPNAGDRTITQATQTAVQGAAHQPSHQVQISYNNTLFEQLSEILLTPAQLVSVVERAFRFDLNEPPGGIGTLPTEAFSHRELLTVMKNIYDIPAEIRTSWHLRGLYRLARGLELNPPGTLAEYNVAYQAIYLSDAAFEQNNDPLGEGTLLHEIGHAVWYGLSETARRAYVDLSWHRSPRPVDTRAMANFSLADELWELNAGADHFITPYSATKPSEDFAEHFSAYMNLSERLQRDIPAKYAFMRTRIFADTTFFSEAAPNMRVFIRSEHPDTEAPLLNLPIAQAIQMSGTRVGDDFEMRGSLRGVSDDISGVERISCSLAGPEGAHSQLHYDGHSRWSAETYPLRFTHLADFGPSGTYRIQSCELEDRARNTRIYTFDPTAPTIEISVGAPRRHDSNGNFRMNLNPNDVRIESVPGTSEPIYEVSFPVENLEHIVTAEFHWRGESSGSYGDQRVRNGSFIRYPNEPNRIGVRSTFAQGLRPETFSLERISFFMCENTYALRGCNTPSIDLSGRSPRIQIDWRTTHAITSDAHVLENQISHTVEYHIHNQQGGDTRVHIQIPIEALPPGTDVLSNGHITLRTPSDRVLLGDVRFPYATGSSTSGVIEAVIDLPPNHEEGIYIIDSMEVRVTPNRYRYYDDYSHSTHSASCGFLIDCSPMIVVEQGSLHLLFRERGIRATITVGQSGLQ